MSSRFDEKFFVQPQKANSNATTPLQLILICNNEENRHFYSSLLSIYGHKVSSVCPEKLSEFLLSGMIFDLAILDFRFQGLESYEAISILRDWEETSGNKIKILEIVSQPLNDMNEHNFHCCDHDAYLIKPFSMDELLGKLSRLASGQKTALAPETEKQP